MARAQLNHPLASLLLPSGAIKPDLTPATASSDCFFPSRLHRQGRCSQHQGYRCHIRLPTGCCSQRSAPQLLPTGDISQALVLQVSTNMILRIFPTAQNFKDLEVMNVTLPKAIVPRSETLRMSQISSSTASQRYRSADQLGLGSSLLRKAGRFGAGCHKLFSHCESRPGLAALELKFFPLFLS